VSEDRREQEALEEFLQRRSRVSQAYRDASGEQPPPALDAAILAASRRALGAGPRRLGWAGRWGTPLAAAAVLVLAVTVMLRYEDEPQIAQLKAPEIAPEAVTRSGTQEERPLADVKREVKIRALPEIAATPPALPPASVEPSGKPLAQRAPAPVARERRDESRLSQAAPSAPAEPEKQQVVEGMGAAADYAAPAARLEPQTAKELDESRAMRKQSAAQPAAMTPRPETLIKQIEAHYAQGRSEEGDRALREFCRDFPGYALPEALGRHAARLRLDCGPGE
jgi:hypothetical protein